MTDDVDALDVAWAAGLFEGEGCFALARSGKFAYLSIRMGMTDRETVERFQQIMGVGRIYVTKEQKQRKRIYSYSAQSRADVAHVLALLRPWLSTRRRERLAEIQTQLSPVLVGLDTCAQGHHLTPENRATNGVCRICKREKDRATYWKDPEKFRKRRRERYAKQNTTDES